MLGFTVPPGATDCHMHVFGDPARFPAAAIRGYDPTPATLAEYRAIATARGLARVVLVQPSAYGTDNRCMMEALRALPDATRGVAVIDDATPDSELDELHALGVRGIRLNLVSSGIPAAEVAIAALRRAAERVGPRGWHVQIFALPALFLGLRPAIGALPVPVVIDHMGGVDAGRGLDAPGLADLLRLLEGGNCWVKVSGANRISRQASGFYDALPIMRALITANPDRAVWGTDWPHIGPHDVKAPKTVTYMDHDNTGLLRLVGEAAGTDALRRKVLVDNPAQLYGFAA